MSVIAQLNRLEGDGLIQVAATQPDLEYLFRHGLIKDAAYHSLLRSDRRALHRAVAEALEAPSGLPRAAHPVPRERLPELAHHFAEAGDAERAQHYHTLAGAAAAGLYANAEAITHYTRALAWAAHTPTTAAALQHLHLALGRAQELSGDYAAAQATYLALEQLGRQRAEPPLELASLIQQVVIHAMPNANFNAAEALRLADRAAPLAQQLGDQPASARLAWARMLAHGASLHYPQALAAGKTALGLARALNQPELLAVTLMDLSRLHSAIGALDQAALGLAEARGLWQTLKNLPMLTDALTSEAALAFFQGRYTETLARLAESLRLSQSIGNAWGIAYTLTLSSYVLLDQGDLSAAVTAMHACVAAAAAGGFIYPLVGIRATLGVAYTFLGDDNAAEAALSQAQQAAEQLLPSELAGVYLLAAWRSLLRHDEARAAQQIALARAEVQWESDGTFNPLIMALVETELAVRQGRPAHALDHLQAHRAYHPSSKFKAFQGDVSRAEGEALLALGRHTEADQVLRDAYALAAAQPNDRTLWTLSATLARVAAQRGDAAGAAHWQAEAKRHRADLAARIDDPAQRAAFLARAAGFAPTL